jgi:hypothetical protein
VRLSSNSVSILLCQPTGFAEGLLEYLSVETHRPMLQLAWKLSAPGSRFIGFEGNPWNLDYCHSVLRINFPHVGLKIREETVEDFRLTGWSQNITILDDYDLLPHYAVEPLRYRHTWCWLRLTTRKRWGVTSCSQKL